jgi:hypothetical protein
MRSAEVNKIVSGFHLGTGLGSAGALQLHHEEVKFQYELAHVLILPHGQVNIRRRLTYLLNVSRVETDEFLYVFLHCKRTLHLAEVFQTPSPEVFGFGSRPVSSSFH